MDDEIATEINISHGGLHNISLSICSFEKLAFVECLALLMAEHKEHFQSLYSSRFVTTGKAMAFVTGDESWVHNLTSAEKRSPHKWRYAQSPPPPKMFRQVPPAGKTMLTLFCCSYNQVIVNTEILPRRTTINATDCLPWTDWEKQLRPPHKADV